MRCTKLTPHQEEKLRELDGPEDFHLSAVAGSGKTFVAVRKVLQTLNSNDGQVLFVAPSKSLCFHFLRWLVHMHVACFGRRVETLGQEEVLKIFSRLRLMHAPYNSILTASINGGRMQLAKDESSTIEFVLSIVDEAHHIFRPDVEQRFLRESLRRSKQRILISDASQSSALEQNFPPEFHFRSAHLSQIVRSTERIILGAKPFQVNSQQPNDVTSLASNGPPLKTYIFDRKSSASLFQDYCGLVQDYCHYTSSALSHVISSYPDLKLHHNVAILVPDLGFLQVFKPFLEKMLQDEITCKELRLIDFEESLSYVVSLDTVENSEHECIILDSIDNAMGLEELIVITVAMDARIIPEGSAADLGTRARLYQCITRAQLMAIVVNELLPGGWLEHLTLCKLMRGEFDEVAGSIESSAGAATKVVKEIQEIQPVGNSGKKPAEYAQSTAANIENNDASLKDPARSSAEPSVAASTEIAGGTNQKVMHMRESVVWDTSHNNIQTPIYKLRFDPSKKSPAEAFEILKLMLPAQILPSNCPYPNDCLFWRTFEYSWGGHPASTTGSENSFLFFRDGTVLQKSRRLDLDHSSEYRMVGFDTCSGPDYEYYRMWSCSAAEGHFDLYALTLSGTFTHEATAREFEDSKDDIPWAKSSGKPEFSYTSKEFRQGVEQRERQWKDWEQGHRCCLNRMMATLSEAQLKRFGMDSQHLWFWQSDL